MTDIDEMEIRTCPSEAFRWVLIHPYEGVLYFDNPEHRDDYAADALIELEGDRKLGLMCCAEIDTLFVESTHVH